jgi:hypothetical protein
MGRPGLQKHPKFRRLVHTLKLPTPYALGLLECLWDTAYERGDARVGDSIDVELAAQWPGDPGTLCEALLKCGGKGHSGFIDERDGIFYIHDLADHQPSYVCQRKKNEEERRVAKVCEHCRTEFRSPKAWAKYCGDACRVAAYRQSSDDGVTHAANGVTDGTGANHGKDDDLTHDVTHVTDGVTNETHCNESPSTQHPAPQKKGSRAGKFLKPTLEEIRAYCAERGNIVDPEKWFDYYTANGWKVGKNPMKNWKAAVRRWEKNAFSNNCEAEPINANGIKGRVLTPDEIHANNRKGLTREQRAAYDSRYGLEDAL